MGVHLSQLSARSSDAYTDTGSGEPARRADGAFRSACTACSALVHGTVAVMTSPVTPPSATLTARAHVQPAPCPEIVKVSIEASVARTVPPLLDDIWTVAP
jgi:hypothetical protein